MTIDQYQVIYKKTLKVLGIPENLSKVERLKRLLEADEMDITASMVDVFMTPVITLAPCDDHTLIPRPMPTYSDFHNFRVPDWCQEVMIGDAKHECIIWNKAYRRLTAPDLISRCTEIVGADSAQKILDLYSITLYLSPVDIFYAIEKLSTDGMYLSLNYDAMRAHPDCYAYHLTSPLHMIRSGSACLTTVSRTSLSGLACDLHCPLFNSTSPAESSLWLRFVRGGDPWAPFGKDQQLMLFGPNGAAVMKPAAQDSERGYARWEAIRNAGLIDDFGRLLDELCILRQSFLDPKIEPRAIEVLPLSEGITLKAREMSQIGLL